jgi:hypothetical protein
MWLVRRAGEPSTLGIADDTFFIYTAHDRPEIITPPKGG